MYSWCSWEPGKDGEPGDDGADGEPGEPGEPGRPGDAVYTRKPERANIIFDLIFKARKLLVSCCDRYYKRDTQEVDAESASEETERVTRDNECVYYVQYAGGKQCRQYYKYVCIKTHTNMDLLFSYVHN